LRRVFRAGSGRLVTAVSIRTIAARAPEIVGSPWIFVSALAAVLAWIVLGAFASFSGGWVLWPATATSVGAFLLVLLLQYSQNRDTRAVQLKLDELIRASEAARTELVRLESMPDEHLAGLEAEFTHLREAGLPRDDGGG
jgi:low affinity Fe/Cu permease